MAVPLEGVVAVREATELKRGGLYALRIPVMDQIAIAHLVKSLQPYKESHGVTFMLFEEGMEIVEVRPVAVAEIEAAIARALAKHFPK